MRLQDWRKSQNLTLQAAAEMLMLPNATAYQRYEIGMHRPDAPLVEAISVLTSGAVTPQDMHETRLHWLRRNRPDRFDHASDPAPGQRNNPVNSFPNPKG